MSIKPLVLSLAVAGTVCGVVVLAQPSNDPKTSGPPKTGNAHLWAQVGSFQLEGSGTVRVKFTGTLLIVRAKGAPMPKVSITGNVRKEFENADMGRIAWFGTGNATVTGSWRHLTVFGKNMDATWHGNGIAQVFGEFDAKGKTGFITVDGSEPFEWLNSGLTYYIPAINDPRIIRQPDQGNEPGARQPQLQSN